MAVNNSLAKTNNGVSLTYNANGEEIKLSTSMIKNYLVSGNGAVTDQEVMMFLTLCRYQHLNPFLREAYLIKYDESVELPFVRPHDEKRDARYAVRVERFHAPCAGRR